MLLLQKLDKLVVAIYKRLVEVYNKECSNFKRFAASAKLSVFKSNDKAHQDEDVYALQAELRSLLQEKLRILRLPYLLELVALMGESNCALATSLLTSLVQIRPAIASEIVPAVRESHQVPIPLACLYNDFVWFSCLFLVYRLHKICLRASRRMVAMPRR